MLGPRQAKDLGMHNGPLRTHTEKDIELYRFV